ncbi:hypothetical protein F5876DRAFT_84959 [Lentinula aff. lateritia]|uniref:Uncharacterized protein n=1 Tax=Lentinula aff. lateritia TaxID=2804960 RepID=A0ACC1TG26_9AGAR|nr:hypothetical protein F5876DRAFT_84959 [Lentinula aff. lateritia]
MSDSTQPAQPAPTPPTANNLMAQLIEQVANPATAMEECSSARSSMKKPEVFKGKDSAEACRCHALALNHDTVTSLFHPSNAPFSLGNLPFSSWEPPDATSRPSNLLATSRPANVLGISQDLLGTSLKVNPLHSNYS